MDVSNAYTISFVASLLMTAQFQFLLLRVQEKKLAHPIGKARFFNTINKYSIKLPQ
jgi:hypothetical protein